MNERNQNKIAFLCLEYLRQQAIANEHNVKVAAKALQTELETLAQFYKVPLRKGPRPDFYEASVSFFLGAGGYVTNLPKLWNSIREA